MLLQDVFHYLVSFRVQEKNLVNVYFSNVYFLHLLNVLCLLFNLHPGAAGEGKHTAPHRSKQHISQQIWTKTNTKNSTRNAFSIDRNIYIVHFIVFLLRIFVFLDINKLQ